MSEIYVVVAENNRPIKIPGRGEELFYDKGGPLVFEQYTRSADLEEVTARAKMLSKIYGKCRIAKLEFIS